jgi:hypothetical protein
MRAWLIARLLQSVDAAAMAIGRNRKTVSKALREP